MNGIDGLHWWPASPNVEMDGTSIYVTLFLPDEWTKNINGSACTCRQSVPLAVLVASSSYPYDHIMIINNDSIQNPHRTALH